MTGNTRAATPHNPVTSRAGTSRAGTLDAGHPAT